MSDPRPAPPLAADLATLFEQAPCGYLSTALDGSIELVNETFLNWTGFARPQLLGRRFVDLLTRGGRIYHETHFAPLLAMQGAVSEIALEVVCSDGSRLPVLVNARAVAGVDTDARVAVVVFDARQRRAYEQELLRARNAERMLALTLQQSLLADPPRPDPRLAIAIAYEPAGDPGTGHVEVGGDWYDAFALGADRIALVVGDVVGHGVGAASATGRVRGAVRALALAGFGVDRLLERLDAFVELDEPLWMATLAYAEIDLRAGQVRIATAGHPPPIIQRSGTAPGFVWEGRSAALGSYGQPAPRPHTTLAVRRGDRLVLYSDGLVERRGESIDVGLDRLLAHLAQEGATPLEKAVQALPHAIVPTRGRDDLCVLGVQYVGD